MTLKQRIAFGKTMKRAAKQFAKYDADANGSLSKEELIALIEKK